MKNLNYTFLIIFLASTFNVKAQIEEENILNVENHQLQPWQLKISEKPDKNILDYYLLLPKQILETEIPISNDSEIIRKETIRGKLNGYLVAQPYDNIEMALFKDRINHRDIVAVVIGCGEPPIQTCSYGFIEYNTITQTWTNRYDLFPWKEYYKKCDTLRTHSELNSDETFTPNLMLPARGTIIGIIDAYSITNVNFNAFWNGSRFILK